MAGKTFLAFGCLHNPITDPGFFDFLIRRVTEFQPDYLINLGDFIDMDALASFAGSKRPLYLDFDAAKESLTRLNDAAPQAHKVLLQGNHEERLWRWEHEHIREAMSYLRWPEMKTWKHIEYVNGPAGRFNLGQVVFAHGHSVSFVACKTEAHYATNQQGLYVHAHTHRPHPVHEYRFGQTLAHKYHCNVGTGIDEVEVKKGYMKTKRSVEWGAAILTGEADTKRLVDTKPNWTAKYELYRMFECEPLVSA